MKGDISFTSEKFFLLIFFSLHCEVCYGDVLKINKLYDKFSDRMEIIGITRDDVESINKFCQEYGIKFPIFFDRWAEYQRKFKIKVIPYKVMLRGDKIIYKDDPYKNFSERDRELYEVLRRLDCLK